MKKCNHCDTELDKGYESRVGVCTDCEQEAEQEEREQHYHDKWQDRYDNDTQDLYQEN